MTLRSQLKSKSKAEAVRATTQRLITDMEMNSTYRGAVEITNLCRHLHPHDTLFAECVRTFGSQSLEGWSWIKRMENIVKKEIPIIIFKKAIRYRQVSKSWNYPFYLEFIKLVNFVHYF